MFFDRWLARIALQKSLAENERPKSSTSPTLSRSPHFASEEYANKQGNGKIDSESTRAGGSVSVITLKPHIQGHVALVENIFRGIGCSRKTLQIQSNWNRSSALSRFKLWVKGSGLSMKVAVRQMLAWMLPDRGNCASTEVSMTHGKWFQSLISKS